MVSIVWSRLLRVRITVVYAVILVCVTTTLSALGPMAQDSAIRHASTNLHNLSHGHLATLFESAFVVDAGPIYEWLPGLVCLLGLAELLWGSGHLVIAFAVGHVGASLLVAVWLTIAIELAWLPPTVSAAEDVGMSYGAVAVLGAITGALRRPWRPIWIGWWFAVVIAAVAVGDDFVYIGHAVAFVLGMVLATRFGAPHRWTWPRVMLLFVGAGFGYLVLTNGEPLLPTAGMGAIGATLGAIVAFNPMRDMCRSAISSTRVRRCANCQRNSSADASIQSDRHDSGGSSSSSPGISQS
jgi:hypothetical protein